MLRQMKLSVRLNSKAWRPTDGEMDLRSTLIQIVALLVIAAVPAVATAWWHPRSPYAERASGAENLPELSEGEVDLATAQSWGEAVLWIDARTEAEYGAGHVPGALLLNEQDWEEHLFDVLAAMPLGEDGRTVVYCGSERCGASKAVADRLREETGLERVYVLHGGWEAWRESSR